MTHVISVPTFDNLVAKGADVNKVTAVFAAMKNGNFGMWTPNPNKGLTGGNWLLPPQSNTDKYGPVPPGMNAVEYTGPGGSYLQIVYDKVAVNGVRPVRKISLFAPGTNGVQIAGQLVLSVAQSAIIGMFTAGAGALAEVSTASTAAEGATAVDDIELDLGTFDYDSTFNSFNYSDGEAFSAFSDAQNVDFGFTNQLDFGTPGSYGPVDSFNLTDDPDTFTIDYGSTPEPSTGFGTNAADSQFKPDGGVLQTVTKQGVDLAVKSFMGPSGNPNQTTATGGGTKESQSQVKTYGSAAPTQQAGQAPSLNTAIGVMGQIESMLGIGQTGQLKPNTTSSPVAQTTGPKNFYLIAGVALIAFAVILKGNK
jgi:hypothetical protein